MQETNAQLAALSRLKDPRDFWSDGLIQQVFSRQPTKLFGDHVGEANTSPIPGFLPPPQVGAPLPGLPSAPGAAAKTFTVQRGHSLSLIAKELYRAYELWPLIWDMNKVAIPNPNRITPGMVLKVRELGSFTPAEIAGAKARVNDWKKFPL